MYEDILDKVDFDDKDVLEKFIKGVLENMDKLSKQIHEIDNDIQDIKEAVNMDII